MLLYYDTPYSIMIWYDTWYVFPVSISTCFHVKNSVFLLDIELFWYPDLRTYQFVSQSWYYSNPYCQVLLVCCKFYVMWHKVMSHPRFSDTQTSTNGSLFYGNFQVFLFCLCWGGVNGDLWFAETYYYWIFNRPKLPIGSKTVVNRVSFNLRPT